MAYFCKREVIFKLGYDINVINLTVSLDIHSSYSQGPIVFLQSKVQGEINKMTLKEITFPNKVAAFFKPPPHRCQVIPATHWMKC